METLDPAQARRYRGAMSEEVSKRIDDLHKRFDDLRGDVNRRFDDVDRRFDDLRGDMNRRFDDLGGDVNRRFGDLREDLNHRFDGVDRRFTDMSQKLTTFMWIVSGWFTFLTAVLAVFGFLRL